MPESLQGKPFLFPSTTPTFPAPSPALPDRLFNLLYILTPKIQLNQFNHEKQKIMKKFLLMLFTLLFAVLNGWAQTQYVNALGASTGWYSDDTRDAAGADLVGLTKTLYGKPPQQMISR
jgi:hypothetical protein